MHTGDQAGGIARILEGRDDVAVSGRPRQLPWHLEFLPQPELPLQFCAPAADCAVRDRAMVGDLAGTEIDGNNIPFG